MPTALKIRRSTIYSTVLVLLITTVGTIVFLIVQALGQAPFSSERYVTTLVSALVIGVSFEPLRTFLRNRLNQLLFKHEYQQQQLIHALSDELKDVFALDHALELIMHTLVRTFKLHHAAIFVFNRGESGTLAIKRIKYIGYSSSKKLYLDENDYLIQYFTLYRDLIDVDTLEQTLIAEEAAEEHRKRRRPRNDASERIRSIAVKRAVLHRLHELDASVAVPLYIEAQLVGIAILSAKRSGLGFSSADHDLISLLGPQVVAAIEKARLFEGDQMKTEFISIASHELLTPISAIEGYLSMILEEHQGHVDPQAHAYLTKVYGSARRLSQLIEDLLSVSRLEADRLKIEPASLDLNQLIIDVRDQLQFMAAERGLALTYEPPSQPLPRVWADPDRTTQLLVNLISNGLKYTPKGSVNVTAVAYPKRQLVQVTITDTGIGISAEQQLHLFEKFYRVASRETEKISGTGLGLYICKSIAEKMGGSLSLKSSSGKGSSFTFTLPIFTAEASTDPAAASQQSERLRSG